MKSLPMTFQDKVRLARKLHKSTGNNERSLSNRLKEILGGIEMKEIKDSVSTKVNIARYRDDLFDKFNLIRQIFEKENGYGKKKYPTKVIQAVTS